MNVDVPDDLLFQWVSNRWIHLPSGRTYSTSYNPPKILGSDDVTGEPLTKRPDDNSVRNFHFHFFVPVRTALSTHPLLGNVYSSPRTLLCADLASPLLLRLAGVFHTSRGPVRRLGHHLACAGDGHARIFPWCPCPCSPQPTNTTRTTTSQVAITRVVGRRGRTLHFVDVLLLKSYRYTPRQVSPTHSFGM